METQCEISGRSDEQEAATGNDVLDRSSPGARCRLFRRGGGATDRVRYLAVGSQEQLRGRQSRWELFLSRAA